MTKNSETKKLYYVWWEMKRRCSNDKSPHYKNYGGRGITVSPEWQASFAQFLIDMGPRPVNYTLERIENDKGYSKENCKWATRKENNSNRRSVRFYEFNGLRVTAKELSKHSAVSYRRLLKRLDAGWELNEAINKPAKVI